MTVLPQQTVGLTSASPTPPPLRTHGWPRVKTHLSAPSPPSDNRPEAPFVETKVPQCCSETETSSLRGEV
jgi:hypothetical protein